MSRVFLPGAICATLTLLSGCSVSDLQLGSFYIQPGKFQFLRCPDFAQRLIATSMREKELASLTERAKGGHDGPRDWRRCSRA